MNTRDEYFMRQALELAHHAVTQGEGGPFGALVVLEDEVIGRGWNRVITTNDPTAHAEINALREACQNQQSFHLPGATLYTSCEPCPMCLSAAYWARVDAIVYAANVDDAAAIGFSDRLIRDQFHHCIEDGRIPVRQCLREESLALFRRWQEDPERILY